MSSIVNYSFWTIIVLTLVVNPPFTLRNILIDTAIVLGFIFLLLAIKFIPKYQATYRNLIILGLSFVSLLFFIFAYLVYLNL